MEESEAAISLTQDPLQVLIIIIAKLLIQVYENLSTKLAFVLNPNYTLAAPRSLVNGDVSVH